MSLYAIDLLSNKFIVALLNSNVLFDYYREFINCSVNIQVNDIKQLPIIIPTKEFAFLIESLADKAIKKKPSTPYNERTNLLSSYCFSPIRKSSVVATFLRLIQSAANFCNDSNVSFWGIIIGSCLASFI